MVPVIYNLRSLGARRVTTLVTAVGVGLVVFVFAAALMLSHGIRAALRSTGEAGNVTVLREGSESDIESSLDRDQAKILCGLPEVQVGADGQPLCTKEVSVLVEGDRPDGGVANLALRGIDAESPIVHAGVHLIDGRMPRPGTAEIMVGKGIAGRFRGLELGGAARWMGRDWPVVGVFEAGGSAFESQVWGDADVLMQAFQRPVYSTVTMRLGDPHGLARVAAAVAADPRLRLQVKSERDWYASQSEQLSLFISVLGIVVSLIFAIGATIGATITMYAQVAARIREIGTLRAIGFRRRAILASFLLEAVLLSLLGAGLGLVGASLLGALRFRTVNFQTFSEMTFRFAPTGAVYLTALLFAVAMGLLGGFLPAWRAARLSPIEAMRSD